MGRSLLALVLFLHRWLGVLVGAVMTLWCLSGFVMLYVDYPSLKPAEQLRGLAPLRLPAADRWGRLAIDDDAMLASATLETMAGRSVLRIVPAASATRPISQMRASRGSYDLATGRPLAPLSAAEIETVGATFGLGTGIDGMPVAITPIDKDQWTVQSFRDNRPLYRIDYGDDAGSTSYVAGGTGEIVQQTTRFERFWGWLGSVPHWLYPMILRQDRFAWSQVVIWTSLAGCFLTVAGIWIGIARLRRDRTGALASPYRGLWWWHHVFGLFFGLFTLSWVASGLFSMTPGGFLDSEAGPAERQRLAGDMAWADLRTAFATLPALPSGTVRLTATPLAGRIFFAAIGPDGHTTRLDASGHAAPLTRAALQAALANGPTPASLDLLGAEDAYYYGHKQPVKLPVWRAILNDGQQTRLYIDADSGRLLRALDRNARGYRWLEEAPHNLDLPILRQRPIWDIVVLPLLAMVTLVCATGTWMGFRKIGRDIRRLRRRLPHPSFRRKLESLFSPADAKRKGDPSFRWDDDKGGIGR